MVAVISADDVDAVVRDLRTAGEQAWIAGEIVPGDGTVELGDNGATG
jgi:phosphoribosylformylglycinamidine cyclo-ligase